MSGMIATSRHQVVTTDHRYPKELTMRSVIAVLAALLTWTGLPVLAQDPPAAAVLAQTVASRAAVLEDVRIPLNLRRAELRRMSAAGDEVSARALITVAGRPTYLNRFAVESLGAMRGNPAEAEVRVLLTTNLDNADALMATASIRAYGRLCRETAVPALAGVLARAGDRQDGFCEMVASAAVETLAGLGSADAVPVLAGELGRAGNAPWSLEYGSRVIRALEQLNGTTAAADIRAYAARLTAARPADPLAGGYYDTKIAEALRVADLLD
jgi:hypothetical protein